MASDTVRGFRALPKAGNGYGLRRRETSLANQADFVHHASPVQSVFLPSGVIFSRRTGEHVARFNVADLLNRARLSSSRALGRLVPENYQREYPESRPARLAPNVDASGRSIPGGAK
jgi:hypothetical protein